MWFATNWNWFHNCIKTLAEWNVFKRNKCNCSLPLLKYRLLKTSKPIKSDCCKYLEMARGPKSFINFGMVSNFTGGNLTVDCDPCIFEYLHHWLEALWCMHVLWLHSKVFWIVSSAYYDSNELFKLPFFILNSIVLLSK